MTTFEGFPPELFEFFEDLERDNTKAFWLSRRDVWDHKVRVPMLSMLDELSVQFGHLRMFRPNRDVRFSKDKSPYKLWTGATSETQAVGGIGYYFSLSATTMTTGYGAMAMHSAQAKRFRNALLDERSGAEFEMILSQAGAAGFPVTSGLDPLLQRVPTGFPKDHPRSELIRWRGVAIVQEDQQASWMHTRRAIDRVRQVWEAARPLKQWLDSNVADH